MTRPPPPEPAAPPPPRAAGDDRDASRVPWVHVLVASLDALAREAKVGIALVAGPDWRPCYANPAFHWLHAVLHAVSVAARHPALAGASAATAAPPCGPVLGAPLGATWPHASAHAVRRLLSEVHQRGRATAMDVPVAVAAPDETDHPDHWVASAWPVHPLPDPRDTAVAGARVHDLLLLTVDTSRAAALATRLHRDVTERVLLHALAEAGRADLAEAARSGAETAARAQTEALASMGHELRTPLHASLGHIELLLLELHGPVTPAQRAALGRVNHAQQHLLRLVNDVLALAHVGTGHMAFAIEALSLDAEVADAVALVAPLFREKGLALVRQAPTPDAAPGAAGMVWGDRLRLRQVLLNLLSNALKFTPAEGRVTVRIEAPEDDPARLAVHVRDTGIGIPADALAHVFEPFVRASAPGAAPVEGTGLGLTIARELARGMGGDLTLTSTLGGGTCGTLWVRRTVGASGQPVERPGDAHAGPDPASSVGLHDAGGARAQRARGSPVLRPPDDPPDAPGPP